MGIEAKTAAEAFEKMKLILGEIVPAAELKIKSELVVEIQRLKKEQGAIILGHNYMEPALYHTVPDIVGDSLELSRRAAETDANPIIFCGVRFMAETAKILNPNKMVLLPAKVAGCSLAASITAQDVIDLKKRFRGAPVVTYINTYADVKAESDVCCTSGNAKRVMDSFKDAPQIIFLPDEYLARNTAAECGKTVCTIARDARGELCVRDPHSGALFPIPEKLPEVLAWFGRCEVHEKFSVSDIQNARKQFPDVEVLCHPECSPEVVAASDISSSTSRMIAQVRESKSKRFLILTECSMADNIMAENPGKEMLGLCSIRCPHMNEITLEDTLHALTHHETVIELDEELRRRAYGSVARMLEL